MNMFAFATCSGRTEYLDLSQGQYKTKTEAALLLADAVPFIRLRGRGNQIFHSLQPSGFKETKNDDDHHQHCPSQRH